MVSRQGLSRSTVPQECFGDDIEFHHIGLLTGNPAEAKKVLSAFGYNIGDSISDPLQNVNLMMATSGNGGFCVEIIQPHEDNTGLRALVKRKSDYMYHTCYRVSDLEKTLERLRSLDVLVAEVSPPKPAVLFNGEKVSFYLLAGVGLVEFLETDCK